MAYRRRLPRRMLSNLVVLSTIVCATPLAAAPGAQTNAQALETAFAAAAQEFGVPQEVIKAIAFNESRWEQHDGLPSTTGGYGVMHLVDADQRPAFDAKGEDQPTEQAAANDPSQDTLDTAAQLINVSPDELKRDTAQNIRGGAALLQQYAKDTTGTVPSNSADWYGAVVKYSGSDEAVLALGFADDVYATIKRGEQRTTSDGQQVNLAGKQVDPNTATADSLHLRNTKRTGADCPNGLACQVIPAGYKQNSGSASDYGNYDLADRERDGSDIEYIVIHDTETPYAATIRLFQNSRAYVSSHYVLRASDGQITQMVDNKNVAWTAGNWYINAHSINFEHEGYAIEGASWYSEQLYRSSARLVRYLADKYGIPLDRAHIIGHDEIPHPTTNQRAMHWDPGPFWDWAHYMRLIGAPINPSDGDPGSNIVTINPNFNTNTQTMLSCEGTRRTLTQSANFVYLHTAPSDDAPLISNPYFPSTVDPRCANNWGNKAMTGQQFVKVDQQGEWTAIWFSGQKAWFRNGQNNANTVPGSGTLITPKAGLSSIPVYGRAYPEAAAYPSTIPYQTITPIPNYSIPSGQLYVATDRMTGDYYRATLYNRPDTYDVVEGQTEYYLIFYNHRFAYVKASDVDVVNP